MERYLNQTFNTLFMSKGLSPIIATMLLIGIAISVGTIVSIWLSGQSSEYMNKESERRERILNKEGESLVLVHMNFDATNNLVIRLQNNGTSDLEISYMKINEHYIRQVIFCASPTDCELDFNESGVFTILAADLATEAPGVTEMEDISSLEIGTTLGRLFIYNAPSPEIRITSSYLETGNRLITVSGEGSVDDGQIVKWEWCFNWDTSVAPAVCSNVGTESAVGYGAVCTYNYTVSDSYIIRLIVTDDTGMVGVITLPFDASV